MNTEFDFEYASPLAPLPDHAVLGTSLLPPFPANTEVAVFGMGCFWGAERRFWIQPGIHTTAVGFAGGRPDNPGYLDVSRGDTGHAEVVLVVYYPQQISYASLLRVFWESHDPTQGMRQGNDVGPQYRSVIYTYSADQFDAAKASAQTYQHRLREHYHKPDITTEIKTAPCFSYADAFHQQYLANNPDGYCGLGGTGVCYSPGG